MIVLSFATIFLLTVVAILLVWLHIKLSALQQAGSKLPVLSERLARELLQTRQDMSALSTQARQAVPKLENKVSDAYKTLQEIDFVLAKAEKTLQKFDTVFSQKETQPALPKETVSLPQNVQSAVVQPPVKQKSVPQAAPLRPATPLPQAPAHKSPSRQEDILRQHMARQAERHQS